MLYFMDFFLFQNRSTRQHLMYPSMKGMLLNYQYLQWNPVTLKRKTRKKMTRLVRASLVTRAFFP